MRIIFLLIVWIFVSGIGGGGDARQGLGSGCGEPGSGEFVKCSLPIIPGMSGFGVETPAGSGPERIGGTIIHVTNLNSSGTGSLREAINFEGPRVIVFDVSGYIDITLDGEIKVNNPFLTIAGQTAPSPGITLKGNGLSIRTHDVLIQHIRIRVGDDPSGELGSQRDGLEIADHPEGSNICYNVVIDHVSVSWGLDENMSIIQGARNITIANSINSEALNSPLHSNGGQSYGLLYDGSLRNISVIGNLFAHNDGRNPRVKGDQESVFINNVVYNWRQQSSSHGGLNLGPIKTSIIGNVYIRGLSTIRFDAIRLHDPVSSEYI
jgi:pectate lyase